jgi:hypothetical protein
VVYGKAGFLLSKLPEKTLRLPKPYVLKNGPPAKSYFTYQADHPT